MSTPEEQQNAQVKRRARATSRWSQIWIPNVLLLNSKCSAAPAFYKREAMTPLSSPKTPPPPRSPRPRRREEGGGGGGGGEESVASTTGGNGVDLTSLLSDELLLRILALLPPSTHGHCSLVSRRFLRLLGRLRRSLTLLHLPFLHSRLPTRFPELNSLRLLPALLSPPTFPPSPLLLSRGRFSLPLDPASPLDPSFSASSLAAIPRPASADAAVLSAARPYPSLRRISLITPSPSALLDLANLCPTLQDLELHRCSDPALGQLSAFPNLQILRLATAIPGIYDDGMEGITDVGLTMLAHGCRRLVRLELSGCEGSYDGIGAIGKCCPMLEELALRDHRMDPGWVAGLSFCGNLRTLRLIGCAGVDSDPGPEEHLGLCAAMESLQLERCQLKDGRGFGALLAVCGEVRELVLRDCWGLDNDVFASAAVCRRVRFLCIEGCSLLTTEGLESVILSWKELQSLTVVACKSIKDADVSPALSALFSMLKELKWRPDSRCVLLASLKGTGMFRKGGRFFKRT